MNLNFILSINIRKKKLKKKTQIKQEEMPINTQISLMGENSKKTDSHMMAKAVNHMVIMIMILQKKLLTIQNMGNL